MPSGPRYRRLPEPWVFFVDRSLGGKVLAEALRALGESVEAPCGGCRRVLQPPATMLANLSHKRDSRAAFPICMSEFAKPRADADGPEHQALWTLHHGDCLAGMSLLPDASADVVIADPPYEAEAHTSQRLVARAGGKLEREPLTFPPITEEERVESARHMARLARRWILVFCQVEAAMKWRAVLEGAGASYKRTCIWVKPDGKPQYSGDRPGIGYEPVLACHAPGRSRWNGGGRHGVFIVNKGGDPRTGHQTQKPLALMELLVRLFSDPGEVILDPFAGSGTTGVAAIRLGRRFLGWEMNPAYVGVARRRLANAREQLAFDV